MVFSREGAFPRPNGRVLLCGSKASGSRRLSRRLLRTPGEASGCSQIFKRIEPLQCGGGDGTTKTSHRLDPRFPSYKKGPISAPGGTGGRARQIPS